MHCEAKKAVREGDHEGTLEIGKVHCGQQDLQGTQECGRHIGQSQIPVKVLLCKVL